MLTLDEIREMGRKLREVTGGDCDLTDDEIGQAMSLAASLSAKGAPGVSVKNKATISEDISEILGPTLARLAAAGHVVVEDAKGRTPRTVDALAAQVVARERAAAWERWRRDQGRRNAYSGFWGGPEDTQRQKAKVKAMTPAQRKTAFQGWIGGPQETPLYRRRGDDK